MKKKISLYALQVNSFVTGASNLAKTIKGGGQFTDIAASWCWLCHTDRACPSDMPSNCNFTESPTCPDIIK